MAFLSQVKIPLAVILFTVLEIASVSLSPPARRFALFCSGACLIESRHRFRQLSRIAFVLCPLPLSGTHIVAWSVSLHTLDYRPHVGLVSCQVICWCLLLHSLACFPGWLSYTFSIFQSFPFFLPLSQCCVLLLWSHRSTQKGISHQLLPTHMSLPSCSCLRPTSSTWVPCSPSLLLRCYCLLHPSYLLSASMDMESWLYCVILCRQLEYPRSFLEMALLGFRRMTVILIFPLLGHSHHCPCKLYSLTCIYLLCYIIT